MDPIKEAAVELIIEVLERTRELSIDELLVAAQAVMVQAGSKYPSKVPGSILLLTLTARHKENLNAGFLPQSVVERLERVMRGEK